jgi:hypothetical protein
VDLYNRPWFIRMWVIQVVVIAGELEIDWVDIGLAWFTAKGYTNIIQTGENTHIFFANVTWGCTSLYRGPRNSLLSW